jgi:hypothetical protein
MFIDEEEIVKAGRTRLLIASGVLVVASILMCWALTFPGPSRIWSGGFVITGWFYFQALRAYKLLFDNRKQIRINAGHFGRFDVGLIALSVVLVAAAGVVVLPEALRVYSPSVGTCWAEESDSVVPVACWSPEASFRTILQPSSASNCPGFYLEPNSEWEPYKCLEELD